jgi:hypothetical protein
MATGTRRWFWNEWIVHTAGSLTERLIISIYVLLCSFALLNLNCWVCGLCHGNQLRARVFSCHGVLGVNPLVVFSTRPLTTLSDQRDPCRRYHINWLFVK